MEKLKEIFHKLKNTEINLKDLKISSLKEKLSSIKVSANEKTEKEVFSIKNLKNLKNISWQDIKSFDYKNFYIRNKQQILTVFVALMVVFFLFYWTNVFLDSKLSSSLSKAENTYKKLENAANMAGQIQFAKSKGVNAMTLSLLVFIQNTGSEIGISDKIVNLRPVTASKGIEHVSLRMENLYYDELVNFLKAVEKYDNLSIKVINFNKRYDNPKMIDASIEVVKM